MANRTRQELVEDALGNLGVVAVGQPIPAEDFATVDAHVDPLIKRLAAESIVTVSDLNAIPLEWFAALSRLLANAAGPKYGSPINRDARVLDEDELRRLTAADPTYETLVAEYF
jgi:hypothetical protein